MSATCEKMQSLIPLAVDGDLDEAARARVLAHARSCRRCAEGLAAHSALRAAIGQNAEASPPPLYFEGVLAEIHRRMPMRIPAVVRPARRRRIPPQTAASAAAAAMVFLWFGAAWGRPLTEALDRVSSRGFSASQASRLSPVPVAAADAPTPVTAVEGIGWVAASAEILRAPAALRRELGLPAEIVRGSLRVQSTAKDRGHVWSPRVHLS
ncbi:MAG: zf-HC2 domain-containing protein [Candidatus Sumerlaeota bacterium]|nr:zf-HC2 domain-containing protein [Candidatus Sumerlaeota bacterium]